MEVLKTNGYPDHVIRAAAKPKSGERCEEDTPKYTICLPYVSGLIEDLRRVCRKYDIRMVFTTISTPQQLIQVKDTDPLLSRLLVVYKIPCSDCEKVYTGGTRRALGTRLKEHQAATRLRQEEKSSTAEHAWMEDHCPTWDDTVVLEQARNDNTLRIKEALCIMTVEQQHLLNRDQGTAISDCWKLLLCRTTRQGSRYRECILSTLTPPPELRTDSAL